MARRCCHPQTTMAAGLEGRPGLWAGWPFCLCGNYKEGEQQWCFAEEGEAAEEVLMQMAEAATAETVAAAVAAAAARGRS